MKIVIRLLIYFLQLESEIDKSVLFITNVFLILSRRLLGSNGQGRRRKKRGRSKIHLHVLCIQRHISIRGDFALHLREYTEWTPGDILGRSPINRQGLSRNYIEYFPGSPL